MRTKFCIHFSCCWYHVSKKCVEYEKNSKIRMNEKNISGKIDILMQLCTVSLCKFQGKVLFLQNMDTVLLRECFFLLGLVHFFVTSCILHYFALFFNFVCKRHASLKTKLTHV